jgi:hypothetical protein
MGNDTSVHRIATPATYSVKGRQYVVIAAGGGKNLNSASGGVYVDFASPQGKVSSRAFRQRRSVHQ